VGEAGEEDAEGGGRGRRVGGAESDREHGDEEQREKAETFHGAGEKQTDENGDSVELNGNLKPWKPRIQLS